MFIITDLTIFRTVSVGIVMAYIHTKLHMPSSSGPLVITVKLKTKYRLHADVMLLYTL
jgi:hypothetical protein